MVLVPLATAGDYTYDPSTTPGPVLRGPLSFKLLGTRTFPPAFRRPGRRALVAMPSLRARLGCGRLCAGALLRSPVVSLLHRFCREDSGASSGRRLFLASTRGGGPARRAASHRAAARRSPSLEGETSTPGALMVPAVRLPPGDTRPSSSGAPLSRERVLLVSAGLLSSSLRLLYTSSSRSPNRPTGLPCHPLLWGQQRQNGGGAKTYHLPRLLSTSSHRVPALVRCGRSALRGFDAAAGLASVPRRARVASIAMYAYLGRRPCSSSISPAARPLAAAS